MTSDSVEPTAVATRPSLTVPPSAADEVGSLLKALWREYPKATALGGALAVGAGFIGLRALRSKSQSGPRESSGVFGTIVKSSLLAAVKAIGTVELTRILRKLVGSRKRGALVAPRGPSRPAQADPEGA